MIYFVILSQSPLFNFLSGYVIHTTFYVFVRTYAPVILMPYHRRPTYEYSQPPCWLAGWLTAGHSYGYKTSG